MTTYDAATEFAGGEADLATLDSQGRVPDTRMGTARQVQDFVRRLWDNDDQRARKRAYVRGLIDGNPPYNAAKLREAGRADAANVNWGTGRTYMESGTGAFYDLFSEAPGCVAIKSRFGQEPDEIIRYGRTMSGEADRILLNDPDWDFHVQNMINEMTLFGVGPLMFEDCYKVLPKSVSCASLKVPEWTPATTSEWDASSVDVDYYPPQLYKFIEDEKSAKQSGWNPAYVKKVIQNASDMRDSSGRLQNWEWYQQKLKNNASDFMQESKMCKLAFVFWKEFDGRVTMTIVERNTTTDDEPEFLFKHVGWYQSFQECVHPFYFDRGNGGYHHSVTGLGVKMYGAMEYENRLLCNLMDKAFAPKVYLRPLSAESLQKNQIQRFGDYAHIPPGTEVLQNPIQGYLSDGLAMWRASGELMRSNLSSYRQQVPTKNGNPITARQAMLEASQTASLSKTSYSRFYKQLDLLYAEVVRRLCLRTSTDPRAKEFQKRCIERGVPEECFLPENIDSVRAQRVVGQGSALLRQDAIMSLAQLVGGWPEDGRQRWNDDLIATTCGQAAVERYNPRPAKPMATDQESEALQWVAAMKVGVPPVITSSQNAVTYAMTFLKAASQSLESLQQGGNPQEVLAFLQICGPAIMAHLQRFANDPIRKPVYDAILKQWKDLATVTDKLQVQIQRMVEARAQQAQKTQAAMNDAQLKQAKTMSDIELRKLKTKAQLDIQAQKAKQSLALSDAQTASAITREGQKQTHEMGMREREMAMAERESEHEMAMAEKEPASSSTE